MTTIGLFTIPVFEIESQYFTEYRFLKTETERIIATVTEGKTALRITGKPKQVPVLEAALLRELSSQMEASFHRSSLGLARTLEHVLDEDWLVKLQHQFVDRPSRKELHALLMCHKACPLPERIKRLDFPDEEVPFATGGPEWGVRLHFSPKQRYWWFLERLELC